MRFVCQLEIYPIGRRATQPARPIENNEEYRRNQRERPPEGGISGILVVQVAGKSAAAGAST
ncbi:hypothetical protein RGCCGE502_33896 (plasmid) [Rhizobium grahamii CCGE 502]|uniref:Uncharacterized protein n=1 Tax=Rhizobium grahamii CCGE 502 TaxID=990285 RepID=S3H432_9HYPH|nr:hypothetical protein RGCCGE502_33896 [Rhizobium grahamii CCGE 502]